jgi:hypothetical protein
MRKELEQKLEERRGKGKGDRSGRAAMAQVGIVYWVGDKLFIDSTPVAGAGRYGDSAIHERDHIWYWAELVKSGIVPDSEYEQHPRGRVSYNEKTGEYTLLADRCILGRKKLVRKILSRLHLPVRGTETGTDSHYRCFRCLGPRNVKQ